MNLSEAMYATLKIYVFATAFIFLLVGLVMLFSYVLNVWLEPEED